MSSSGAEIRRGDIWVVEPGGFPKPRPALVISIDAVNDLCPDVLLIPLTTKPGPLRVAIRGPRDVTGLEADSYAKCESVGPLHKGALKRRIGRVPKNGVESVEAGVRRVLGL